MTPRQIVLVLETPHGRCDDPEVEAARNQIFYRYEELIEDRRSTTREASVVARTEWLESQIDYKKMEPPDLFDEFAKKIKELANIGWSRDRIIKAFQQLDFSKTTQEKVDQFWGFVNKICDELNLER